MFNDTENACRLIALHGEDLRYCHALKKWLVWDGMRWAVDDTVRCRLAKKDHARFLKQAVKRPASRQKDCSRSSMRGESQHALYDGERDIVRPEELDHKPLTSSNLKRTIDLKSAELRPHGRGDSR